MFGIGMPEMILILAIALIVIGPKKLPDLAKSLGRAMREFKKATNELKESMEIDTEIKDVKKAFDQLDRIEDETEAPNASKKDAISVEGETINTGDNLPPESRSIESEQALSGAEAAAIEPAPEAPKDADPSVRKTPDAESDG